MNTTTKPPRHCVCGAAFLEQHDHAIFIYRTAQNGAATLHRLSVYSVHILGIFLFSHPKKKTFDSARSESYATLTIGNS